MDFSCLSAQWCAAFLILALLFGGRHASAQQTEPNLSGTWKLNLRKSKLGPQHGYGGDTQKIKHSGSRLEITYGFNQHYSYLIDGKERIAHMARSPSEEAVWAKA